MDGIGSGPGGIAPAMKYKDNSTVWFIIGICIGMIAGILMVP